MATNQSTALKHWARIIQQWPVDRVRPNHVLFQTVMQSRVDKITPPANTNASTAPTVKANDAIVSPARPPILDEEKELRQIQALDALLTNKYANTYPIPQAVRYPQSSPNHYNDLIKELDEAPDRTWAASFVKRLKGALRFS
ncbi:uncharacterized protein A1O9_00023 [Exophiala aquamarina CBS 119918]|uniref:Uncharacterized protein n=1 Tax=Exophiala aquamarina CBS 119918 TaxID=1182545 RepID=A0A072PQ92_9EURO|nr:uncharacterized protein A1O9_00023 [Exophiala aquamarina CBS 119918]KEF62051.1 hypothetical protein A1O9_00023 [Exophiala aquamarina CBS 119918]